MSMFTPRNFPMARCVDSCSDRLAFQRNSPGRVGRGFLVADWRDIISDETEIPVTTRNFLLAAATLACVSIGAAPEASAQNAFFAVLSGAFVCNSPMNADPPLCRRGDLDGAGSANVLIHGPNNLCATIIVDNLDLSNPSFPTGAHIHIGQASYGGPVVVQLAVPNKNGGGNPGTSMICNNAVPANTIASIRNNPEYFYIDVHGEGLQFGAVRGQLF